MESNGFNKINWFVKDTVTKKKVAQVEGWYGDLYVLYTKCDQIDSGTNRSHNLELYVQEKHETPSGHKFQNAAKMRYDPSNKKKKIKWTCKNMNGASNPHDVCYIKN